MITGDRRVYPVALTADDFRIFVRRVSRLPPAVEIYRLSDIRDAEMMYAYTDDAHYRRMRAVAREFHDPDFLSPQ